MSQSDLDRRLSAATPATGAMLAGVLSGGELSVADGAALLEATGPDATALYAAADAMRQAQVGDVATYVVNRNINFTNICAKRCHFCAFSRTTKSGEGYFLTPDEVVARAIEAWEFGATEVCMQAGLVPSVRGKAYPELTRNVRAALPAIHIHAFSPEEVAYGAGLARVPVSAYLAELQDAGLNTLPGTSAEILDDDVRDLLAPGRITSEGWVEVITEAHALGIRTSSTMMYGHVEQAHHRAAHMALLRELQRRTGGFTEFVPLSFVAAEAPLFARTLHPGARNGPGTEDVRRTYAVARLMLGRDIPNLQVSWVKDGLAEAVTLLGCGANDLGGTLINESISTSAGAGHGQLASPATLRAVARAAGRIPAERSTTYATLRTFPDGPEADPPHPLDLVDDADARFGSYAALVAAETHRYDPALHVLGRESRHQPVRDS